MEKITTQKLYSLKEVIELLQDHKPIKSLEIDWSKSLCNEQSMPVVTVIYKTDTHE